MRLSSMVRRSEVNPQARKRKMSRSHPLIIAPHK
jgi:hypothetical protein